VLAVGLRVSVAGVNHELVRLSGTAAKPLVRLRAVGSREAVVALRGEPLLAQRDVVGLEQDEYWAEDLVGLAVVDGEETVGVVDRVRAYPSCEVLEVGDLLIPLVSDAVREVDLAAGRIDVDLGFLGAR
jgi:16S rRNA processing protein RimM